MSVFFTRRGKAAQRVNFVDYIQSSGTQFVKTGLFHNATTCPGLRMVIDAEILTTTGAGLNGIGSYQSFYVGQMSGTLYYSPYYGDFNTNVAYSTTKRYVYDLDNASKKFTVKAADGSTVYSTNTTVGTPSGSREIYLFAFNSSDAGSVGEYTKQKLYSAKFYLNGELIQDLWPCYDPDGVACLYDRVNKEYVYNAGSGTFIAGDSIGGSQPETYVVTITGTGYLNQAYVEINGTKYIGAATVAVGKGTQITLWTTTSGSSPTNSQIRINGTTVATAPAGSAATYVYEVTAATKIALNVYTVDTGVMYSIIAVTTS